MQLAQEAGAQTEGSPETLVARRGEYKRSVIVVEEEYNMQIPGT